MSELLDLAIDIAREAGALSRERFGEEREIDTKSSSIDLVTDVDRACDALIRARIEAARPDDAIVTEEADELQGKSGVCWIADPIDGTTNYAHGFPHYAISIGVERDGVREVGVVYDPMKDELFSAERGAGAALNGKPLRVSRETALERSMLATGFAYDVHVANDNLAYFARFLGRVRAVRRAGSAALDLAYVACGRFEGYWELSLNPWDVAAGILLIEEAGGKTSNLSGGPTPPLGAPIVASNGHLHAAMLSVLAESGK